MVHDGKNSFLLNIVDSGAEKKTADYCFMILNEANVEIKTQNGKDVFAICTNNESKMVKMRKLERNTLILFHKNGYRLDLIPKNPYFYNIIGLNLQKHYLRFKGEKSLIFYSKNSKIPPQKKNTFWWFFCVGSLMQSLVTGEESLISIIFSYCSIKSKEI